MNKLIFKLFCSKAILTLIALLLAIILASCTGMTTQAVKEMPNEINENPEVYFCPRDDCGKMLESQITKANLSVYCALYDIDLRNMINALSKKSENADVRVVMDNSNYEEQIKGDGLRLDDEQVMHNKFCVIDSNTVITGSFNPTDNDNNRNNNNIVVIYSRALASNYKDEFNELWNGEFGKGNNVKNPVLYVNKIKIENYFCPEDTCAAHVIDQIKNAKSSVYFMAFSFTNEKIADELIKKENADIRGIFDAQQSSSQFSQLKRLKEFGINAKNDSNKYKMHHKVFIIDNQTVVTGSFNPTLSGDTKNDENLLVIHDKKIANAFLEEFDKLWQ